MNRSGNEEKNLFHKDIILLITFMSMTIAVFLFALLQITHLTGIGTTGCIIIAIASVTIISVMWASIEVMMHLSRNQEHIYKDDLRYQKLLFNQRGI
jgi:ABC-type Na+ efflux pump permease subunit